MHIEEKVAMGILADARRWLNAHGMRRFELADAERARWVEVYRQQIERDGRITYLPPADGRGMKRRGMPVRHPQWRGFAY